MGSEMMNGLLKGLLGNDKHYKACAGDFGPILNSTKHLVSHIKAKDFDDATKDVAAIITAVPPALSDCKDMVGDLKEFTQIFNDAHSPQDIAKNIKKNFLANDEDVINHIEDMASVCTFKAPDGKKCGYDLGTIIRDILIVEEAHLFVEKHQGSLFSGLLKGLLGNTKDYKACAGDLGAVMNSTKHVIADLRKRKIGPALEDLSQLISSVSPAAASCKVAANDLLVFTEIMKGAKTPADVYQKIKRNMLNHDEEIVNAVEDMAKVCTFRAPDGNKCGYDLGSIVRKMLVSEEAQLFAEKHKGSLFSGLMRGLLGKAGAADYKACAGDAGAVINGTKHLFSQLGHLNVQAVIDALSEILTALPHAIKSCKVAAGDLKDFTSIMHGATSPADIYQNVKRNILDHDEEIINTVENMGKVCTFRAPNANHCGYDLGHILREVTVVHHSVVV